MSIKVRMFEWDANNTGHMQTRHPHIDLELLEDIVRQAKEYIKGRPDRYGNRVYGARQGRLIVWFVLKGQGRVRIFSVHEV